jgi:threonine dehydratase
MEKNRDAENLQARESAVGPEQIWMARRRIASIIKPTPLIYSANLSRLLEAEVYLKPECFQVTGSFKVRGACNVLASLSEEEKKQGLLTCSSGNHGAALSYAASRFGRPRTTVFVPSGAEETKKDRILSYGAEVREEGRDFLETYGIAQRYREKTGRLYVHSHGDPLVIAGQGTIGLEILEELPDADAVIVPVGGGGLISGIATAFKAGKPDVRVYGVEAAAAPGAFLSFRDGFCHESVEIKPSLADGLLGTLTPLTYAIASRLVEKIETVEEDEIRLAMRTLFEQEQIMAEGSASVGLAAALQGKIDVSGRKAVFILTGRNVSAGVFLGAVTDIAGH